ncbi:hypothetical protein GCM10027073_43630 [Streptomyces chlorus]
MLALSGACGRASCNRAHPVSKGERDVSHREGRRCRSRHGGPGAQRSRYGRGGRRRRRRGVPSPGATSGNVVQVPVHAPINACGNTVDVIGFLNPAVGNRCVNGSHRKHQQGYGNRRSSW